jgi:tartrate dehydratase alpha subunit/fumarate hydratase class I-like protein
MGKRGQRVITTGDDEAQISRGVYDTYTLKNLRYSQVQLSALKPQPCWQLSLG